MELCYREWVSVVRLAGSRGASDDLPRLVDERAAVGVAVKLVAEVEDPAQLAAEYAQVNTQVRWFRDQLVELLGGYEQQSRLAEELGL